MFRWECDQINTCCIKGSIKELFPQWCVVYHNLAVDTSCSCSLTIKHPIIDRKLECYANQEENYDEPALEGNASLIL